VAHPRRLASLLAASALRPWQVVALIVVLLRTRTEYVFLSGSSAGQTLRTYFNQRWLGVFPKNRFCRGVLVIPQRHSEYLRGPRRQALRTNLHRAEAAGIRCEEISDRSPALKAFSQFDHRRWPKLASHWGALVAGPETTVMVARDERGVPLAIIAAVIDDMVCLIRVAVANSHHARWALHDRLVRTLVDRGVRYLLVEGGGPFGAVGFATGVQYYQHLLGYELRHIIPSADAASRRLTARRSIVGSGHPDERWSGARAWRPRALPPQ
jgi:hypothetical protein